jgi:O-antigen/teichoic acid export membrane protein
MLAFFVLGIYLGLQRIGMYVVIELVLQAIILINALITLIVLGSDVSVLVTIGAIANAVAGIVFTLLLVRDTGSSAGKWRFDTGLMRKMLSYGSRFFVSMAAGLVILRGDLLVVNYFRGSADAGVYAVATQASLFLHMLPNVISTVFFPRSADAKDESGQLTCRVTRTSVFIMLVICVAAAPLAFVLPFLYGSGFVGLPALFLILLPGVFLLGIETIQVQHFTGLGLPRIIPGFWVAVMILVIGLDIVLVPLWGTYAAAAVSTFGYVVIFALVAGYFCSRTGRTFGECFVPRPRELVGLFKGLTLRESRI